MAAVLAAAAMHAGWNALVKSGADKLAEITLVTGAAALAAAAVLPLLPLPAPESRPYLAASVAIHTVYFALVGLAYRAGDLSFAYPLMRGTAPLATAALAVLVLGDALSATGWAGVALLSAGVIALTRDGWRAAGPPQGRTLAFALANAAVIVAYTLVDGAGVRLAGSAWSYVAWMFALQALPLAAVMLALRRQALLAALRARWRTGAAGGVLTLTAYGIVLWAMTQAPIALVAALRETSVVFGVAIASLLLKERFGAVRWVAALLVAAGAAAMKLA